ncbi:MAG TPA: c-type cytochrome [Acidimicrobiia bacterium]|nr:c-type cytochrome [Acidimicrobiia bacterium]
MTANIITVIALVAGIAWLGMLFVSAIRNRGGEEVAPNLRPGIDDEKIETRRLEGGQKAAIAFSAFLAISLPLYFLTEQERQAGFVEEFSTASVARGQHIVEEFACFSCHGPEGSGGTTGYVEKRSGVTVSWAVPSLDDVFFRYDEDEVNFWVTYGRGNTPMPAWGIPGGGPLNEEQVVDVVNYLKTIQIPQDEYLGKVEPGVNTALDSLANAEGTVETAILEQSQVVAEIEAAPADAALVVPLAGQARETLAGAGTGIDTDADGLSDAAETELSAISQETVDGFRIMEPITLDPAVADAELAADALAAIEAASETDPIVRSNLAAIETAMSEGAVDPAVGLSEAALTALEETRASAEEAGIEVPASAEDLEGANGLVAALDAAATAAEPVEGAADLAAAATTAIEDGSDPDGDGLSTAAENTITSQVDAAITATTPTQVALVALDPTNPASVGGEPDLATATTMVGNLESLATTLTVTEQNQSGLLENENGGLAFLEESLQTKLYSVDFAGVAEAMGSSEEEAERAVGLFNSKCARCHTAGYSAGVPYTQEAGSGGFGPALWDGRPTVQFGEANEDPEQDLLVQFIVRGSEAETPYGINGFGSGRMPAFGSALALEDIELLAAYLRSGNMDGKEGISVLP